MIVEYSSWIKDFELSYQTDGAGGLDLAVTKDVVIAGGARASVTTGISVAIPEGHVGLVRGRSGLAFGHGIGCFEGTIDSDYRGDIRLLLWNLSASPNESRTIKAGQRVAQLVIVPCLRVGLRKVDALTVDTARGVGGFGSTGE